MQKRKITRKEFLKWVGLGALSATIGNEKASGMRRRLLRGDCQVARILDILRES